jgi:hypothetical protein
MTRFELWIWNLGANNILVVVVDGIKLYYYYIRWAMFLHLIDMNKW